MRPTRTPNRVAALDELDMMNAILGPGVILNVLPGGDMLLHTVCGGSVRRLGQFSEIGKAWEAIDALDGRRLV